MVEEQPRLYGGQKRKLPGYVFSSTHGKHGRGAAKALWRTKEKTTWVFISTHSKHGGGAAKAVWRTKEKTTCVFSSTHTVNMTEEQPRLYGEQKRKLPGYVFSSTHGEYSRGAAKAVWRTKENPGIEPRGRETSRVSLLLLAVGSGSTEFVSSILSTGPPGSWNYRQAHWSSPSEAIKYLSIE